MIDTTVQLTSHQWILLIITTLITFLIFYVRRKHTFWERQGVKGPKPAFLFGNTFSNLKEATSQLHKRCYKTYGKVFGIYDGLQPHLIIGDSEVLRTIRVKDFNVFPSGFHTIYLQPAERGFLTNLFGPKWKRMRSMLSPTFSSGKMKKMFILMKNCTIDAQNELKSMAASGNADFEPKHFWGRYNMDVIAKCCFAANLDVYKDHDSPLLQSFSGIFEGDPLRFMFVFTAPEWLTKLLRVSGFPAKHVEFLANFTMALIEKRKLGQDKVDDFLQIMIESESTEVFDSENNNPNPSVKSKFTTDEIVSSSLAFLLAGYETTSTLLTWACYRLATNPEVQEKLFQEVSNTNILDYDALNGLIYLEAVLNESLRIDPPIIVFQRTSHKDYVLPGTKVFLPKNTRITIPIYAIHHDPDNYEDPEAFKPERFIDETPKPFTFLPFGAGPRTCIGMRFALVNAKLALATFIRNYKILTTPETPRTVEYSKGSLMLSSNDLRLKIESRAN